MEKIKVRELSRIEKSTGWSQQSMTVNAVMHANLHNVAETIWVSMKSLPKPLMNFVEGNEVCTFENLEVCLLERGKNGEILPLVIPWSSDMSYKTFSENYNKCKSGVNVDNSETFKSEKKYVFFEFNRAEVKYASFFMDTKVPFENLITKFTFGLPVNNKNIYNTPVLITSNAGNFSDDIMVEFINSFFNVQHNVKSDSNSAIKDMLSSLAFDSNKIEISPNVNKKK